MPKNRNKKNRVTRALMERLEVRQLLTAAVEAPFLGTAFFSKSRRFLSVEYDKEAPASRITDANRGQPREQQLSRGGFG